MNQPELELSADVLYGIAQLALDQVDGIRTVAPPARVGEFLTGQRAKGIAIDRDGDDLAIELNVSVTYGLRVPDVAKAAQRAVREAVASMTGLSVRSVDVHVEAIDLPAGGAAARG
ncbi:MAG: Asp23/Gls24 family envelope stress response protein [bacterium]|nr:Asp23/Gls24 family envelope stress response protein [bacterium]